MLLLQCFSLVISEKRLGCTRVAREQGQARGKATLVAIGLFFAAFIVVWLLSLCSQPTGRQGRSAGCACKRVTHTHTYTERGCAALMSYAQRYARTKLVLYILCAVKRLLSAFCHLWSRCRDGLP